MKVKYKTDPELRPIYDKAYQRLKDRATLKQTRGYGPIYDIMGLKSGHNARHEAGILLGEISADAHSKGFPMLSAIIVWKTAGKNEGKPGDGFYNLAVELGEIPANATEKEKEDFWKREVNKIWATDWTK
jgi:hypothetical protein